MDSIANLIEVIEKYPCLYNKSDKGYRDRVLKSKIWDVVCNEVIENWNELPPNVKSTQGREIQSRWQNLRTCFRREINLQNAAKSAGQAHGKRKKYRYFNQLLFLLPTLEHRQTQSNLSNVEDEIESYSESDQQLEEEIYITPAPVPPKKPKLKHEPSYENNQSENNQESLLQILRGRNEDDDEDKLFLLSLLPAFKRLSEDQKFEAKIEFLKVMKKFKPTSI